MLRTRGLRFEPDLVILGYDHNDPSPILGKRRPPMPDDYGENILHSELFRYLNRKFYSRPSLRFRRGVDGHVTGGPDWDRHFEALAGIARLARDHHVPVIVVVYDAMVQREDKETSRHYRLLHEPFESTWHEHGYYVVDCYDLFQEYMRENELENIHPLWVSVSPRDGHPNPEGHRMIAEAVLATIQENGLLE
jgi:hypothetical protein